MAPNIQVNDYDYKMAIEKVQEMLSAIYIEDVSTGKEHNVVPKIADMPSATELVDLVIDTVLN